MLKKAMWTQPLPLFKREMCVWYRRVVYVCVCARFFKHTSDCLDKQMETKDRWRASRGGRGAMSRDMSRRRAEQNTLQSVCRILNVFHLLHLLQLLLLCVCLHRKLVSP